MDAERLERSRRRGVAYLADRTELTELTATIGHLHERARKNEALPAWLYAVKIGRLETRHRELEERIAAFEAAPDVARRCRRDRRAPEPELGAVCSASPS